MEYWVLFAIGVLITVVTRIGIYHITDYYGDMDKCNMIVKIIIHILVAICVSLVGGIIVGKWLGIFNFSAVNGFWTWITFIVFAICIPVCLVYFVGSWIMDFEDFNDKSVLCFIIIYAISCVGWSISICKYNSKIKINEETVINAKYERQLLYFCNVPVQKVSGNVKGSSTLGFGKVNGEMTTTDQLTYWYLNDNGDGVSDTALTVNSIIDFIEDGEDINPYVEIIEYCDKKTTINHNNGKTSIEKNNIRKQYIFHLPKTIMQYNLN